MQKLSLKERAFFAVYTNLNKKILDEIAQDFRYYSAMHVKGNLFPVVYPTASGMVMDNFSIPQAKEMILSLRGYAPAVWTDQAFKDKFAVLHDAFIKKVAQVYEKLKLSNPSEQTSNAFGLPDFNINVPAGWSFGSATTQASDSTHVNISNLKIDYSKLNKEDLIKVYKSMKALLETDRKMLVAIKKQLATVSPDNKELYDKGKKMVADTQARIDERFALIRWMEARLKTVFNYNVTTPIKTAKISAPALKQEPVAPGQPAEKDAVEDSGKILGMKRSIAIPVIVISIILIAAGVFMIVRRRMRNKKSKQ